jgi:hypothetical protein
MKRRCPDIIYSFNRKKTSTRILKYDYPLPLELITLVFGFGLDGRYTSL